MVGSRMTAFLFALALRESIAATLIAEKESVMRKEADSVGVKVTPHGDLVQTGSGQKPKEDIKISHGQTPKEDVKLTPGQMGGDLLTPDELTHMQTQYCNYDFPMGTPNKKGCPDGHNEIIDPSMCIFAGFLSGATTDHDNFIVEEGTTQRWEYKHPKGCFKDECGSLSKNPKGVCYFYNGLGGEPDATVTGTPVCSRTRYSNGTDHPASADKGGCPTGYQVIDDEWTCRTSANCLGMAAANYFRIGNENASQHLDYVQGCLIDKGRDSQVYFNAKSEMGVGKNVKGQAICNVSKTTDWRTGSTDDAVGVGSGATTTDGSTTDGTKDGAKDDATKDDATKDDTKADDKKLLF